MSRKMMTKWQLGFSMVSAYALIGSLAVARHLLFEPRPLVPACTSVACKPGKAHVYPDYENMRVILTCDP